MADPLKPSTRLLAKLGSIAVHADELHGPGGHQFDATALQQLLTDPEVTTWLEAMLRQGFVPRKRSDPAMPPGMTAGVTPPAAESSSRSTRRGGRRT